MENGLIATCMLLTALALVISYHDVRYRRIPNAYVLAALAGGLIINTLAGGVSGLLSSLGGFAIAFALMFALHLFGAMGAGDVKLFGAVGAVLGSSLVLPTFFVIVIVGGALAVWTVLRAGTLGMTMQRVLHIFVGLLPGWQMPRFAVPPDRRHTIPYGVAICAGSLISLAVFRA